MYLGQLIETGIQVGNGLLSLTNNYTLYDKSSGDPLQLADTFADEGIQTRLAPLGKKILSEEREWGELGDEAFVVDPVDGSINFSQWIKGKGSVSSLWGMILSYFKGGRPYEGVMVYPALGKILTASLETGEIHLLDLEGRLIRDLSKLEHPKKDAHLIVATDIYHGTNLETLDSAIRKLVATKNVQITRALASTAVSGLALAEGDVDLIFNGACAWDFPVINIIVEILGGGGRAFDGSELDWTKPKMAGIFSGNLDNLNRVLKVFNS